MDSTVAAIGGEQSNSKRSRHDLPNWFLFSNSQKQGNQQGPIGESCRLVEFLTRKLRYISGLHPESLAA